MSLRVGWILGLNAACDGAVNSLTLRKLENATKKAAVSILLSCLPRDFDVFTWARSRASIGGPSFFPCHGVCTLGSS